MKNCDWCGDKISKGKNNISDDGDNCCNACIKKANDNAKPVKTNSDIQYLNTAELVDLVENLVYQLDISSNTLSQIVLQYRRNK